MKQTCPQCKTVVEIEDSKYHIGDVIDIECPVCGNQLQFCIQKNIEIISDSTDIEDIQEISTEDIIDTVAPTPKKHNAKKQVLSYEELPDLDKSPVVVYNNNMQLEYNNRTLSQGVSTVQVGDSVEEYKEWERSVDETKRDYNKRNRTLQLENAGCWGIGFSFCVPLIGIVLYLAKKDTINNSGVYITASIIGFVIRLIIIYA